MIWFKKKKMHKRLNKNRTKKNYREIVNLAIEETKKLKDISPEITMYQSIFNQLLDIDQKIIKEAILY